MECIDRHNFILHIEIIFMKYIYPVEFILKFKKVSKKVANLQYKVKIITKKRQLKCKLVSILVLHCIDLI